MKLPLNTIVKGDALEVLRGLPDASVHCVVTSPPYWGLRDYGEPGQLGLEPTPEAHIEALLPICREIWRVLRPDGTFWLNYSDCYASQGGSRSYGSSDNGTGRGCAPGDQRTAPAGLKPKDLVMMPARVALALQADGWWLRSDIIWSKPNPMPESVIDRPTNSHEHLFLLSKSARYFYDADAVRERAIDGRAGTSGDKKSGPRYQGGEIDKRFNRRTDLHQTYMPVARNLRSVWEIATQPYPGAHFATFPEKLVEPCIKAGTSEAGCCPECGAPWARVVEASGGTIGASWHDHSDDKEKGQRPGDGTRNGTYRRTTLGFRPTCACDAGDPVPCIVMDTFIGSGTTAMVAVRLGRKFIGIDLAGGDKDLGGHTANERIAAAACGQTNSEITRGFNDRAAHASVGQQWLFEPGAETMTEV